MFTFDFQCLVLKSVTLFQFPMFCFEIPSLCSGFLLWCFCFHLWCSCTPLVCFEFLLFVSVSHVYFWFPTYSSWRLWRARPSPSTWRRLTPSTTSRPRSRRKGDEGHEDIERPTHVQAGTPCCGKNFVVVFTIFVHAIRMIQFAMTAHEPGCKHTNV